VGTEVLLRDERLDLPLYEEVKQRDQVQPRLYRFPPFEPLML
jgi:hypothetical protein